MRPTRARPALSDREIIMPTSDIRQPTRSNPDRHRRLTIAG